MMRQGERSAGWLLVLAAAVATAEHAPGQERGRKPVAPEVRGIVKSVDAAAGTITVSVSERGRAATDKTYSLAKDLELGIATGGARRASFTEGKLGELTPGAQVTLFLGADQKTVESALAEGPILRATLKAVDLSQKTVTITLAPARAAARGEASAAEEKSFPVADRAEIAVDDGRGRIFSVKEAKLADLVTGSLVTLRLSVDLKRVQGILAEGANVSGVLKSMDSIRNTLTLAAAPGRGGNAAEETTFEAAPDVVVLLDSGRGRRLLAREGKLADVPPGSAVQLKLAADQKTVALVRAEGPSLAGLVKAVDPDKGTITLVTGRGRENPEEKTLSVARDARILVRGAEAKLGDIKVEERGPFAQLRLSLDQKTVQAIVVGGGRR